MLILGIRYLNGFVAASHGRYEWAEWPPHPGRVFMAMVAAHYQTGADVSERQALHWLEALPDSPEIHAGEASSRATVTHFVPVNDKSGPSKALTHSLPITRDRQPRTFARAWLDQEMAFLAWPNTELPQPIHGPLAALCGKVSRIGHTSSLVQMWIADGIPAGLEHWIPDERKASRSLRVMTKDTLLELDRAFGGDRIVDYERLFIATEDADTKKGREAAAKSLRKDFPDGPPIPRRPALSAYRGYAQVVEILDERLTLPTVFSPYLVTFKLERKDGPYRYLDLLCTLAVTDRWRAALISHSNDLSLEGRKILSGHASDGSRLERPHLALLTLGVVGHMNADGHLSGLAMALPADLSGELRTELLRAASQVSRLALGRLGRWDLVPLAITRPPLTLRSDTWGCHPEGAREWSSVTPVVFDQHPKAKDKGDYLREATEMIAVSCERIGLPKPANVILTSVSAHLGAPPAFEFPRLRRKDGSERRHTHAILVFDQPIRGPLIVGAGRYRGYGLFRPIEVSQ